MRFPLLRALLVLCLVTAGAVTLHQATPHSAPRLVADSQSASDETAAFEIAQEYGHPVTIDSATTETELIQAEPDHTKLLTENTEPVRVRQNGAWVPTDADLQPVGGSFQPAAAAVPVQFSAGGSGPLAKVRAPSGQWLSESWTAGTLPAPSVQGSTATYPDVYPDVDLVLTATAVGMSEVLVIKDADAAANPALGSVAFGVNDGDLETTREAGGSAVAKAADGSTQLTAASATWWDSSSPGASAQGPGGLGVPQPVTESVTDSQVTIDASVAARTADATYPVFVDPVWTGGELGWTMVDTAYPDQAYWKDAGVDGGNQHVGYIDVGNSDDSKAHKTRSYWQLDTSQLAGTHISSALFVTTEVYSYSCSPRPVSLYTAGVATSSTTWNHQPGLSALSDTENVAYGYNSSCPDHGVGFDAQDAVQRAADASSDVINFALLAGDESDIYGWKKFAASASLQVGYYSIPTVPTNRHFPTCWAVCNQFGAITGSTTPTLSARSAIAIDPNTGKPEDTLRYVFEVCTRAADGTPGGCLNYLRIPVAVSGDQQTISVSEKEPVTDGAWEWRALACRTDIADACSDWSTWYPFTVDTVAPPAPAISSSSFDLTGQERRGREYVAGQVTVTGKSAADDYAYSYSPTPGITQLTGTSLPSPACTGTTKAADVTVHCAGTGDTTTFDVLPQLPSSNSVTVYAYDRAGNPSTAGCLAGVAGCPTIQYDVNFAIANHPQHAWVDTTDSVQSGTVSVQDATPEQLSHSYLTADGSQPVLVTPGPWPVDPTFSFDGTQYLKSDPSVLTNDAGHSFTAAVWVRPAGTGQVMTMLSQGATDSVFELQQTADGHFQFCMVNTGAAATCTPLRDDIRATHDSHLAGTGMDWTLLVAVWNAPARTLMLYDSDANDSARYVTTGRGGTSSSTDPVVVGAAMSKGAPVRNWNGGIGDVLLYQSVLDPSQINALHLTPQNLG